MASVPIISQVLGLLLTPLVTRLYAPSAFGVANLFGSAVMLFAVFSTMGYHGAIILPRNDATASNIFLVCIVSTICVSAISLSVVMIGGQSILVKLNAPILNQYICLTPIFVFLHGTFKTLREWKSRLRRFENLAISSVSEIVVRKFYQLPAGFLGFGTAGNLIAANLTAAIAKNIVLLHNINFKRLNFKKKIHIKLWAVAKRYKKFPKYSVWAELFSRLPATITAFLIVKYFGQDILGYYGLSLMVLAMPSTLIRGSITEAFNPRVAMAKHENRHTDMLEKIYGRLVAIMIFPFMILGLFSERLFPAVFGGEWLLAGSIAQILVFRIFVEIIFSPSLSLTNIMEKQELQVIRSIASSLIAVFAWMLGAHYNNLYLALWCLVLFEGASILLLGGYMMVLVNFPFFLSLKKLVRPVLLAGSLGLILFCVNYILLISNILLFGLIGGAFLVYYGILAYLDSEMLNLITQMIRPLLKSIHRTR